LNKYVEQEKRDRVYKESQATPVFNSQAGADPTDTDKNNPQNH
jgi:hypothetical protein